MAVALETTGRWSRAFHRLFNQIKRYAHAHRTQDAVRHSLFVQHWRQVLCVVYATSKIRCTEDLLSSLLSIAAADVVD